LGTSGPVVEISERSLTPLLHLRVLQLSSNHFFFSSGSRSANPCFLGGFRSRNPIITPRPIIFWTPPFSTACRLAVKAPNPFVTSEHILSQNFSLFSFHHPFCTPPSSSRFLPSDILGGGDSHGAAPRSESVLGGGEPLRSLPIPPGAFSCFPF